MKGELLDVVPVGGGVAVAFHRKGDVGLDAGFVFGFQAESEGAGAAVEFGFGAGGSGVWDTDAATAQGGAGAYLQAVVEAANGGIVPGVGYY
ncbi:MAG: hypothetical protein J6X25_09520 [Bacteroidales bacterium]|nr:hypothetical protein [Bacteroidales bacterium]